MKNPTNRTMPLSAAMARFVDVADLIKSRAEVDEALGDLCEDYRLAYETLARMKRERPRPVERIREYNVLLKELEAEIMAYLLNPNHQVRDG